MTDFLTSLLPTTGFLCLAEQTTQGFRHHWCDNAEMAQRFIDVLEKGNKTVFVAQSSFKTTENRKGVNALASRNFFLDIDVAAEGSKDFLSQRDALTALFSFCKTTSLPAPSVISSGFGLYAHWRLETSVPVSIWKGGADLLKQLTIHHSFKVDQSRTADTASVLRPLGSFNKKHGGRREVKLIYEAPPLNALEFIRTLKAATLGAGIKLSTPKATIAQNAAFLAGLEQDHRPSSARIIEGKCAQVAAFAACKGNVAEPLWYSMLGMLRYTIEGKEIIHEWSQGHEDYTEASTEQKISQHVQAGAGPTTCAVFNTTNPGICSGCRYAERTRSPITLGYEKEVPLVRESEDTEDPNLVPPDRFTVSETGLYFNDGGEQVRVYPFPIYIISINRDHFGESFTIRHRLPYDGWKEVTMASNKTCEQKSYFSALIDAHIGITGKIEKGLFMLYTESFMTKLRNDQRLATLSGQMGWHEEGGELAFIHGAEIYRKDGTTHKVGYSASAPDFVRGIKPTGDKEMWIENTKILNQEGMEGLAFEFLCASFGAPLVRFTGYEGAMLSVVGGSGLGKTLTGKWGISAWGDPKKLTLNQDDTRNVLVGRLGVYNTLPAYIDEVSNITPESLSDLAYKITQGRDKARMSRNAVEKSNLNGWNTLAVVSSNHSLIDKLGILKGDPGAEINRIFEYEVTDGYTKEEGAQVYAGFAENYGQVGKEYALWLVQHQDEHKEKLKAIADILDRKAETTPEERFWTMTGAVAIYGGMIAKKLGLSHVNVDKLLGWTVSTIRSMRKYKNTQSFDAVSFLGALLDKNSNGVLCVASYNAADKFSQQGYREPRGRLVARIELDTMQLWISSDAIKQELMKLHISPRKLAAVLGKMGLEDTGARISLGRGTVHNGISQVSWRFNLANPALGHRMLALVAGLEGKAQEVR
jgi:hypothetical protein